MDDFLYQKENIATDFSVTHTISSNSTMRNYHFHDVFEIYCTLSEGVKYFVMDHVFNLSKGDILVFNHMDIHKSLSPSTSTYERYVALFSPEYIQDLSTTKTDLLDCFLNRGPYFSYVLHLEDAQLEQLLSLLKKGEYYCHNPVYGADIYKKLILGEILLFINQLYSTANTSNSITDKGEYKKIKPITEYIHKNISGDLSLDTLSARFFISKHHMGFLFKKAIGFSVNEYIVNYRINKARELLKKNLPVSEVGELVGFRNLSHFIRTFKSYTGKSPKQYAIQQR